MRPNEIRDSRLETDWDGDIVWNNYIRPMTDEEIKERNMSRATYRLKKDTELLKAGAIVQEACDDGDQKYVLLEDQEHLIKFNDLEDYDLEDIEFSRNTVEKNPTWFEKVQPAAATWLSADELKAFREFLKTSKPKAPAKRATRSN
jgi:hypothetical protein